MRGFADYVAPAGRGFLLLVGPGVGGVSRRPGGRRGVRGLPAAMA